MIGLHRGLKEASGEYNEDGQGLKLNVLIFINHVNLPCMLHVRFKCSWIWITGEWLLTIQLFISLYVIINGHHRIINIPLQGSLGETKCFDVGLISHMTIQRIYRALEPGTRGSNVVTCACGLTKLSRYKAWLSKYKILSKKSSASGWKAMKVVEPFCNWISGFVYNLVWKNSTS